ncbi:fimbrillin family protein [Sphingobacterium sp. HJSM2_6]|uniref:fimbrillin family protein n=1 Tax=Sphingobacterium sp. HJSM2_6 TaxID=3366264 RepID=UPI003BEA6BCE
MKIKLNNIRPIHTLLPWLVIFLLLSYSCKKIKVEGLKEGGKAQLSINFAVFEVENEFEGSQNPQVRKPQKAASKPLGIIGFSENKNVEITLKELDPISNKQTRPAIKSNKNNRAATERKNLSDGIKYKLLVYKSTGELAAEREYLRGEEEKTPVLAFEENSTYTFLVYSINSRDELPKLINKEQLKNAEIVDVNSRLMYFKKQLTLKSGNNYLDIILKHQLGEIKVNLSIDNGTTGTFTELNNVSIKPNKTSASLKLATGVISFASENSNGTPLSFPNLGANGLRSVSSTQTLVINPETNTASLTFGKITMDGDTKENLTIQNIKIKPGVFYELDLNFKTCTVTTNWTTTYSWRYEERRENGVKGINKDGVYVPDNTLLVKEVIAPAADYGVVFDFIVLDNSFNMELNGVLLAKDELQFQKHTYTPQNIMFEDGSMYEGTNVEGGAKINTISSMSGSKDFPLIRLIISRQGDVTIFGSKVNKGKLYPLKLFNGNTFNKFPWNKDKNNLIKFTQLVEGRTYIEATGTSVNKVPCK